MGYEMTIGEINDYLFEEKKIKIGVEQLADVKHCYEFLRDFSAHKIIYGINTGFGPMAQWRIKDEDLRALQYNIIRSHSTGAGKPLEPLYVRAAMLVRLSTFLQAKSGVHPDLVMLLAEFINRGIYPYIPEHGSVGASGDLVQLAHIALCLIGEGEVNYHGEWRATKDVLRENNLSPLEMHIREGLSVCNGTSVMTGIGLINLHYAQKLLDAAIASSVLMNEIASSYDDLMSVPLNAVRRQEGQQTIAAQMRDFATGSQRLKKRENELYKKEHTEKVFDEKVQAYYSLRCVPQVLGPIYDEIIHAQQILVNETNSACDNPIIDPETENVYHGGNFHGDYVSFEMDKLKMAITKMAMLAERQFNYLCHDRINDGILPPFINMGTLGLNYGVQAMQFTATSTTAECQTLSNSMYVHSIPNNNDNQDIVSMGTNSALLAKQVITNAFQVMAIHWIGLAQAVDCLKIADQLAPKTRQWYADVRALVPVFVEDTPKYKEIASVVNYLMH